MNRSRADLNKPMAEDCSQGTFEVDNHESRWRHVYLRQDRINSVCRRSASSNTEGIYDGLVLMMLDTSERWKEFFSLNSSSKFVVFELQMNKYSKEPKPIKSSSWIRNASSFCFSVVCRDKFSNGMKTRFLFLEFNGSLLKYFSDDFQ